MLLLSSLLRTTLLGEVDMRHEVEDVLEAVFVGLANTVVAVDILRRSVGRSLVAPVTCLCPFPLLHMLLLLWLLQPFPLRNQ